MPTKIFRGFLFFMINSDDKVNAYIYFDGKKSNKTRPYTTEAADILLRDLYITLDPFLELCVLQNRTVTLTMNMEDTNIMPDLLNILLYILDQLQKHIKIDRANFTKECNIVNAPPLIVILLNMILPFIHPTFREKIRFTDQTSITCVPASANISMETA